MLSTVAGTAQGHIGIDIISIPITPQEFHSAEHCRFCNGTHRCGQWCLTMDHVVFHGKVCSCSALTPGGVVERCPPWIQETPAKSWAL